MRESCYAYLRIILVHWTPTIIHRHVDEVADAVRVCMPRTHAGDCSLYCAHWILAALAQAGLQDASATGRKTARECFVAFREHWPDEADRCAAAAAAAIYPSLPAHLFSCM